MKKSATIAVGVSAIVVAGVVALAVPAVTAQFEQPTASTGPAEAAPTHEPMNTPNPDSTTEPAAFSDGYQDLGHGTSIPENAISGCPTAGYIFIGSDDSGPMHTEHLGADLVDLGPREFAQGTVGMDDQGQIATYTVAAGDVETSIGERFCLYNGGLLGMLNGYSHGYVIQPGDVLTLNADLITDWVDPYGSE